MSSDFELGGSWLSLTSRVSSVTVSPLSTTRPASFPTSHLKCTCALGNACSDGTGSPFCDDPLEFALQQASAGAARSNVPSGLLDRRGGRVGARCKSVPASSAPCLSPPTSLCHGEAEVAPEFKSASQRQPEQ